MLRSYYNPFPILPLCSAAGKEVEELVVKLSQERVREDAFSFVSHYPTLYLVGNQLN